MITNKQKDDAIVAINEIKLIVSQILFYSSNSSLFSEIDSAIAAGAAGGAEGGDAAADGSAPPAAASGDAAAAGTAVEDFKTSQLETLKTRLKTAQEKLKQNIQGNM